MSRNEGHGSDTTPDAVLPQVDVATCPTPRQARRLVENLRQRLTLGDPSAFRDAVALAFELDRAHRHATRAAEADPAFIHAMQHRAGGMLDTASGDPCDTFWYLLDAANRIERAVFAAPAETVEAAAAKVRLLWRAHAIGWHPSQEKCLAALAAGLERLAGWPVREATPPFPVEG